MPSYLFMLSDLSDLAYVVYPAAAVFAFGVSKLVLFVIYGGRV